MFCTNCGKAIADTDKFCTHCGFRQEDYKEAKQDEKPADQVETQKAQEEELENQKETEQETQENFAAQDLLAGLSPETAVSQDTSAETTPEAAVSQDADAETIPETAVSQDTAVGAALDAVSAQPITEETASEGESVQPAASSPVQPEGTKEQPEVPLVKPEVPSSVKPESTATHGKPPKKIGIGCIIGSVFLSIIAFVLVIALVSAVFVKNITSEATMSEALQEIDYTSMKIGKILPVSELGLDVDEDSAMVDIIYDAISEYSDVDISKDKLQEIIDESSVSEYISEKLAQYSRYALKGEELSEITSDEIISLVQDNKEAIEEVIGDEISTEDLDDMKYVLDNDYAEVFDALSVNKIDQTLENDALARIRAIVTDEMLILVMIFVAVLLTIIIIFIGYINRKVRAPFIYIGIPVLISGVLFSAAMLMMIFFGEAVFDLLGSELDVLEPLILDVLERLITVFAVKGAVIGAVTAGAGLLMIVCYIIMKKAGNSRKTSKAAVAA